MSTFLITCVLTRAQITKGNEGVDVKEGAIENIIEDNEIYMQLDNKSGGWFTRLDTGMSCTCSMLHSALNDYMPTAGARLPTQ